MVIVLKGIFNTSFEDKNLHHTDISNEAFHTHTRTHICISWGSPRFFSHRSNHYSLPLHSLKCNKCVFMRDAPGPRSIIVCHFYRCCRRRRLVLAFNCVCCLLSIGVLITFQRVRKRPEIRYMRRIIQGHFQSFAFSSAIFKPKLHIFAFKSWELLPFGVIERNWRKKKQSNKPNKKNWRILHGIETNQTEIHLKPKKNNNNILKCA